MMASETTEAKTERPKEVHHDEAPSGITDHMFIPKGAWYTLCKICNLAESAHAETGRRPLEYIGEDEDDD